MSGEDQRPMTGNAFMIRTTSTFLLVALLAQLLTTTPAAADGPPAGAGAYEDLVDLVDDFVAWRDPTGERPRQIIRDTAGQPIEPIPDYGREAIAARVEELAAFQARLADMNVAAWPRDRQVDWLAVRSRLDQQAFILQLQRPWARDPGFYVDRMLRVTFTDLPVTGEARDTLLARLRAMPVLVAEERANAGVRGVDARLVVRRAGRRLDLRQVAVAVPLQRVEGPQAVQFPFAEHHQLVAGPGHQLHMFQVPVEGRFT